jgi:hypothetical protein
VRVLAVLLIMALFVSSCYGLESRKRASQLEFEKGMRLYNRCEFECAKGAFEHSLWLNPKHEGSKTYLAIVRRILVRPEEYE